MRASAFVAVLVLTISTQAAVAQSANCPPKIRTVHIVKGVTTSLRI